MHKHTFMSMSGKTAYIIIMLNAYTFNRIMQAFIKLAKNLFKKLVKFNYLINYKIQSVIGTQFDVSISYCIYYSLDRLSVLQCYRTILCIFEVFTIISR